MLKRPHMVYAQHPHMVHIVNTQRPHMVYTVNAQGPHMVKAQRSVSPQSLYDLWPHMNSVVPNIKSELGG